MIIKEVSWEEFCQSYSPSRSKEVLVLSSSCFFSHSIYKSCFIFHASDGSAIRLNGVWLSPFFTSYDCSSFAIIFNMLFFVLRVCRHGPLLKLNNYKFKSPKSNQAFPLIIKLYVDGGTLEVISIATWFVWATSSIYNSIFFSQANFRISSFNKKRFPTGWLMTWWYL